MAGRLPFPIRLLAAVVGLAAVLYLTQTLWLPALGYALIRDDGPAKADLAVVLGGDYYGDRILKAGDLVKEGFVPAALVSGPAGFFGEHECDLAIEYAVHRGYPAKWFVAYPDDAHSTRDEARLILPDLKRRHVHRILLVTSDYHSARAERIFRATETRLGDGIEIRTVTVPDRFFHPGSWWRSREGQKVAFFEWMKTVSSAIGM
ncbi:MAG TPA: YdcF family protein [Bryobacteraceae bacterium]|nr:YdcF family protein [Bryobacteraceae bacterium]